jgi:hypothetical protein
MSLKRFTDFFNVDRYMENAISKPSWPDLKMDNIWPALILLPAISESGKINLFVMGSFPVRQHGRHALLLYRGFIIPANHQRHEFNRVPDYTAPHPWQPLFTLILQFE